MNRKSPRALLCWIAFSSAVTALVGQTPASGIIVPGVGVAGLKLGSTVEQFRQLFPNQSKWGDYQNGLPNGCPREFHSWFDERTDDGGLSVYLWSTQIDQISIHTSRFSVQGGLHLHDPAAKVEKAFPQGRMHVLKYSGGKVNGGRDLKYWVDRANGIAFEICCSNETVSGVDVFQKGQEFRPEGCVSPPQEWKLSNPSRKPLR